MTENSSNGSRGSGSAAHAKRIVSVWLFLLMLFALTTAAISFHLQGDDILSARGAGRVLGGALGALLLTGLAPVVWWATRRFSAQRTTGPLVVWTGFMVLFGVLTIHGAGISKQEVVELFHPEGCDFVVTFPGPIERRQVSAGGVEAPQARFNGDDYHLRAECMSLSWRLSGKQLRNILRERASADGLSKVEITAYKRNGYDFIEMRGHKMVGDIPATYKVLVTQGTKSVVFLMVAGVSSGFPQEPTQSFVDSLRSR